MPTHPAVRIFLAAALTQKLGPDGMIDADHRLCLEAIITALEKDGHEVVSAHVRERWGADLWDPEDAVQDDFKSISECDILVVVLDDTPSFGVPMEMGWAMVWGKPIVQVFRSDKDLPYFDLGIRAIAHFVPVEWSEPKVGLRDLRAAVHTVVCDPTVQLRTSG